MSTDIHATASCGCFVTSLGPAGVAAVYSDPPRHRAWSDPPDADEIPPDVRALCDPPEEPPS